MEVPASMTFSCKFRLMYSECRWTVLLFWRQQRWVPGCSQASQLIFIQALLPFHKPEALRKHFILRSMNRNASNGLINGEMLSVVAVGGHVQP
jgi:hypothetical protein